MPGIMLNLLVLQVESVLMQVIRFDKFLPYQQAFVARPEQPALRPNAPRSELGDPHPIQGNALQFLSYINQEIAGCKRDKDEVKFLYSLSHNFQPVS